MKKTAFCLLVLALFTSCGDDSEEKTYDNVDFRQEMRDFVIGISQYARGVDADFIVIPQNGQELVTIDGETTGAPVISYLQAINGVGREDLFYGYNSDDQATPTSEKNYMVGYLDICEANSLQVLSTDYCSTHSKMDDSYSKNLAKNYISFAAPQRELNVIPTYPIQPFNLNTNNISSLGTAKNFLYLINPDHYTSKQAFIAALSQTNYDLLIIDCFFNDELFTSSEINQLKTKQNGGKRLVISYMSIGEAEDYRYYWQSAWNKSRPVWFAGANPDWPGNYKVLYWDKDWQAIIFGNDNSYLKKILNSGFDGVYLDIIDAFEYFE